MRNFRKAAFAGATAVAVAFGSSAVATAAETQQVDTALATISDNGNKVTVVKPQNTGEQTTATKIGGKLGAFEATDTTLTFNGTTHEAFFGGEGFEDQAPIYKLEFLGGIAVAVAALVGLVVGPLYNFLIHGPF